MPFFSVIMPVYSVEKYIMNSIKSVCNQTYKDFELILVNDGSPDKSIDKALQLLGETTINYHIINQENKGVSSARNEGIKSANGEWIICVDPDDMLHKKTLELTRSIIEKEQEISVVFLKYRNVSSKKKIRLDYRIRDDYYVLDKMKISEKYLYRKSKLIAPGTVIKKSFIMDKNLFFDENVIYSEDQLFLWNVIGSSKIMAEMRGDTYNYLIRPLSTMRGSGEKKIMSGYKAFFMLQREIKNKNVDYGECGKYILSRWVFGVLHSTAKYMDFDSFFQLANKMDYKSCIVQLTGLKDARIRIMTKIMKNNFFLFWVIGRIM